MARANLKDFGAKAMTLVNSVDPDHLSTVVIVYDRQRDGLAYIANFGDNKAYLFALLETIMDQYDEIVASGEIAK